MTERTGSIPTGRVRRTAKVGRLVAGEVAKAYGTKAANLVRPEESRSAANERRRMEAASRVVAVKVQYPGAAAAVRRPPEPGPDHAGRKAVCARDRPRDHGLRASRTHQ